MTDSVVIIAAKRTPIGHFLGYYKDIPATQLGSYAIEAALKESSLSPNQIDEVLMGCVLSAGLGQAPARQAAIGANLSTDTPCTTLNKMCGSGMKAVMLAHDAILANTINNAIAGGMENMTRAPYLLPGARMGYRMGSHTIQDHMQLDGLIDAYGSHRSMGEIAEQCASKLKISRNEQDDFARASNERAIHATKSGLFSEEITPITTRDKDNEIRLAEDEGILKSKPEKIAQLKPAFLKDGTITAANASSISDGAAALVLMRESAAQKHQILPLAKIIAHHSIALAPDQFPIAPIQAIEHLLKKISWSIDDVDLFEINEAFAIVAIAAMKTLKIPHEKLNIHGGACILGHPIGASGARILVTLIHALKQRKLKRGIAALCIGGGEATAIAIERL